MKERGACMKKSKILVLCGLLLSLAYLIAIPTIIQAAVPGYLGGKKVLTGPNGKWGCDCTKEVYVDCYCQIIENP